MKKFLVASVILLLLSSKSFSQDGPFLGEIRLFSGNYAPRGWMICNGQTLQVQQYSALFSILGTIYGGDGKNNFKIPDLRGRIPVGTGLGNGLSTNVTLGSTFGTETNIQKTIGIQAPQGTTVLVAGNVPINNREPALGLNYIICLMGVYPSKD